MPANNQPPAATSRFDSVDLLRGLSILAVILLHINIHLPLAGLSIRTLLPRWLYHLFFTNGDNGVTVFFAISGFLITLTSLRRFRSLAAMRPAIFYRIRFARIAPLLLLLLSVLSLLHLAHAPGFRISPKVATLPRALFAALTFHINWLEASARAYLPADWDVLWSLSVEEMFYLFFPLLCLVLLRRRIGQPLFVVTLLAFLVIGPIARSVWAAGNPIWADESYLGGMDAIALGCLCAMLTNRLMQRELNARQLSPALLIALQIIGAGLMFWIALWPRWHWMKFIGRTGLDGTLLPLGACCVMLATVLRATTGGRWTASLRWMGRHSYELYLTHSFFVVSAEQLYEHWHPTPSSPLLSFALWAIAILILSMILAGLIARFFTEPMNRILRGAAPPHH